MKLVSNMEWPEAKPITQISDKLTKPHISDALKMYELIKKGEITKNTVTPRIFSLREKNCVIDDIWPPKAKLILNENKVTVLGLTEEGTIMEIEHGLIRKHTAPLRMEFSLNQIDYLYLFEEFNDQIDIQAGDRYVVLSFKAREEFLDALKFFVTRTGLEPYVKLEK